MLRYLRLNFFFFFEEFHHYIKYCVVISAWRLIHFRSIFWPEVFFCQYPNLKVFSNQDLLDRIRMTIASGLLYVDRPCSWKKLIRNMVIFKQLYIHITCLLWHLLVDWVKKICLWIFFSSSSMAGDITWPTEGPRHRVAGLTLTG